MSSFKTGIRPSTSKGRFLIANNKMIINNSVQRNVLASSSLGCEVDRGVGGGGKEVRGRQIYAFSWATFGLGPALVINITCRDGSCIVYVTGN